MTSVQARPKQAALVGIGALLLSLLACGPAIAASIVTELRNEPATELADPEITAPALIPKVPDQTPPGLLAETRPARGSASPTRRPYPDLLLHQRTRDEGLDASVSSPLRSPVADADTVGDDPAESTSNDEALRRLPVSPVPGVTTHLPGVSDTDMPRFKRQMYRTDI